MPTYEYVCTVCDSHCEDRRPVAQRDAMVCARCGAGCERIVYPGSNVSAGVGGDQVLAPLEQGIQQQSERPLGQAKVGYMHYIDKDQGLVVKDTVVENMNTFA